MKKIYLQPEIVVVKIELTTIVAGSDPNLIVDKNGGASPDAFGTKDQNLRTRSAAGAERTINDSAPRLHRAAGRLAMMPAGLSMRTDAEEIIRTQVSQVLSRIGYWHQIG